MYDIFACYLKTVNQQCRFVLFGDSVKLKSTLERFINMFKCFMFCVLRTKYPKKNTEFQSFEDLAFFEI